MSTPLHQIYAGIEGVGFVIEYRETRDSVCRPMGHGWAIVRSGERGVTLWRRISPFISSVPRRSERQ